MKKETFDELSGQVREAYKALVEIENDLDNLRDNLHAMIKTMRKQREEYQAEK